MTEQITHKPISIRFLFDWTLLEGGQFKPVTLIPTKPIQVAVDIPLQKEYIANVETVIQNQLYDEKVVIPILTPAGMKYALDEIQYALSAVRDVSPDVDNKDGMDDLEIIE